MQLLTVPPGGRAKAHKHEAHETALYVLSGKVGMYYGEKLENHMVTGAGDSVYISANTPHLPYNMSQTEPATAVISRTDPNEQESVVLLPEPGRDPPGKASPCDTFGLDGAQSTPDTWFVF